MSASTLVQIAGTVLGSLSIAIWIVEMIRSQSIWKRMFRKTDKLPRRFRNGDVVLKSEDGKELFTYFKDGSGKLVRVVLEKMDGEIRTESAAHASVVGASIASSAEALGFQYIRKSAGKRAASGRRVKVKQESNLIMRLLEQKEKNFTRAYFALVAALAVSFGLHFLLPDIFNAWVLLVECALLLLCFANQYVLRYRVRKGMYGGREFEAREIVAYILEQSSGGQGGGRTRLDFPKEEFDSRAPRGAKGSEAHG